MNGTDYAPNLPKNFKSRQTNKIQNNATKGELGSDYGYVTGEVKY